MASAGGPSRLARYAPVPALAAALLAACWACYGGAREEPAARLRGWGLPEMVAHLLQAGLNLRAVETAKDGAVSRSLFLTETDQGWGELNLLPKAPGQAALWRGTLYAERGRDDETWEVRAEAMGEGCLVAGPFLFFGDPDLLAWVRAALGPDLSH